MIAARVAAEEQSATGEPVMIKSGGMFTFDVIRDGEVIWTISQPGIYPIPGELRQLLLQDS